VVGCSPEHEGDVDVMRDLPPLPLPQYAVVPISCPPRVPAEIAADLRQTGVSAGLIGYEYRPLAEAAVLDGFGGCGVVVFGSCSLFRADRHRRGFAPHRAHPQH
jgi:hypothetical protein